MRTVFREPGYSYSIEPLTKEDTKAVWANTWFHIKVYCAVISVITVLLIIPLFFLEFSKEELLRYLLIAFSSLIIVQFLSALVMLLHTKGGLQHPNKIVEKGVVTKQDNSGDSETINYSYIGKHAYRSLPGHIKIGDRISIEHTLSKKNKKHLFIRAEKIG